MIILSVQKKRVYVSVALQSAESDSVFEIVPAELFSLADRQRLLGRIQRLIRAEGRSAKMPFMVTMDPTIAGSDEAVAIFRGRDAFHIHSLERTKDGYLLDAPERGVRERTPLRGRKIETVRELLLIGVEMFLLKTLHDQIKRSSPSR